MSQKADFNNYPLPEALTRRVVGYLNAFRVFISVALMFAFQSAGHSARNGPGGHCRYDIVILFHHGRIHGL